MYDYTCLIIQLLNCHNHDNTVLKIVVKKLKVALDGININNMYYHTLYGMTFDMSKAMGLVGVNMGD